MKAKEAQKKPWVKPQLVAIAIKETLGGKANNQGSGKGKGNSGQTS